MGMNFTSITLGVIVISMLGLGLVTWMGDLTATYGIPINSSTPNTYNKMNEMINLSNQMNNQIIDEGSTTTTGIDALLQQGQAAVTLATAAPGVIGAIGQDAAEQTGIPWWFILGVTAMILVTLGLLLFASFIRAVQKL